MQANHARSMSSPLLHVSRIVLAVSLSSTLWLVVGCSSDDGGAPESTAQDTKPASHPAPASGGELLPDDASIVASQLPRYPLDACPVSGEPLGSMGKPANFVWEGRLVRFCCAGCDHTFVEDPAKYLAIVDEAIVAAQLPSYPTEECIVNEMGVDELETPTNYIHGTRLVRLCCDTCIEMFLEEPEAYIAKLDELESAES